MKWDFILVLLNLLLYLSTALVIAVLIVRTEKKMDWAFKVMFIAPIVLAIASVLQLDRIAGIFPVEFSRFAFYASRLVANLSFFAGFLLLLGAVSSRNGRD